MSLKSFLLLSITLIFLFNCKKPNNDAPRAIAKKQGKPKFEKIPEEYSKLFFNNKLKEEISTRQNLFDYDYFYNGAGVGIADLNNDGLQDIFFWRHLQKGEYQ